MAVSRLEKRPGGNRDPTSEDCGSSKCHLTSSVDRGMPKTIRSVRKRNGPRSAAGTPAEAPLGVAALSPPPDTQLEFKEWQMPATGTLEITRRTKVMHRRGVTRWIGVIAMGLTSATFLNPIRAEHADRAASVAVDLAHRSVPRLAPGIVIGRHQDRGYSDLVTLVLPRLSTGHVDSLPEFAKRYANMFNLTILANVTAHGTGPNRIHLLEKVGIGFSMSIDGAMVVVTQGTANDLGANLGMIDRGVLAGNEDCLEDVIQVARTRQLIMFDAKANMLVGNGHEERVIRHLLWASPATGKLGFLVWQLRDVGSDDYEIDCPVMQLLPSGYREDRQIHVSESGWLSSIPTADRFALVRLPQGTPVPFTDQFRRVAGKKRMTPQDLAQLLSGTTESLAVLSTRQPDPSQR